VKQVAFEGQLYRLIPSRFPPVSVYEGLVANDRIEALVEVENRTNPRLQSETRLRRTYSDASLPKLQNWNLAPFKYLNPEGSRFFDPTRPTLELADDRQTALAVSVARRSAFLSRTKEAPIGLDMRMLKTPVAGSFLDLRHLSPELTRDERWRIGAAVPEGADGVIYHPPERPSATCIAVLRGDVLGHSVQTVHYRYVWNGLRISMVYAFDDEGRKLLPDALSSPDDALAA
jgi:hypothetical protein